MMWMWIAITLGLVVGIVGLLAYMLWREFNRYL